MRASVCIRKAREKWWGRKSKKWNAFDNRDLKERFSSQKTFPSGKSDPLPPTNYEY